MKSDHKKWSLCFYLIVLFVACGFFVYSTIGAYLHVAKQASTVSHTPYSVILDAGHGGEDGGAVGKSVQPEKDINLSITFKLKELLESSGFQVILTRTGDDFIGDNTLSTLAERKKSDMKMRLHQMELHPESIFVSVHQNYFDHAALHGAQVFYSTNHENSSLLADTIQNSVVTLLQQENKRQAKAAEKTIYLLRNATIPAVIVECGFLSNLEEAQKLCDDTYQNEMAFSIYCGLLDYFAATTSPLATTSVFHYNK